MGCVPLYKPTEQQIECHIASRDALDLEHKKRVLDLNVAFIKSFNKLGWGDTVTDHLGSIVIDKVRFTTANSLCSHSINNVPQPCYYGRRLTQSGELRKDGSERTVFCSNIISYKVANGVTNCYP